MALGGCRSAPDPLAPPEIVYGEDVCDQCGMIIMEARFAAAMVVEGERGPESRIFDDIGEMVAYGREHPDVVVRASYVHDHDTLEWLDAHEAHLVHASELVTPMGHGLAAFADPERAVAFAAERGGRAVTLDGLLDLGTGLQPDPPEP